MKKNKNTFITNGNTCDKYIHVYITHGWDDLKGPTNYLNIASVFLLTHHNFYLQNNFVKDFFFYSNSKYISMFISSALGP